MNDPNYNAVPPGGYSIDGDEWVCPECGVVSNKDKCPGCGSERPEEAADESGSG